MAKLRSAKFYACGHKFDCRHQFVNFWFCLNKFVLFCFAWFIHFLCACVFVFRPCIFLCSAFLCILQYKYSFVLALNVNKNIIKCATLNYNIFHTKLISSLKQSATSLVRTYGLSYTYYINYSGYLNAFKRYQEKKNIIIIIIVKNYPIRNIEKKKYHK